MDIEKLIEAVRLCGSTPKVDQCKQCAYWSGGDMSKCIPRMTTDAATALSTLQAANEKLWAELEQMTLENNALWTYIEIVDREYRRYMDRGYIDRLDELKKVWKRGQKED